MQLESLTHYFIQVNNQLIGVQAQTLEQSHQPIYNMYQNFHQACTEQIILIENLSKHNEISAVITPCLSEYQVLMEEISQHLINLINTPVTLVLKKHVYEEIDEVISELEDWIESTNELLEDFDVPSLNYIEAWDIGVFFL